MKSKSYRMIVCSFLILPLYSKATPKNIDELCKEYYNTKIYPENKEIKTYMESLAGYREFVVISFSNGHVFQVEAPGKQHLESQKRPLDRMKDTLRAAYFTGMKINKICAWTNKTPHSIAAIELSN